MKKYISLLTIAISLLMFSCERSEMEIDQNLKKSELLNRQNLNKTDSTGYLEPFNETLDPPSNVEPGGEDDEPERDKQHWRIIIKS